MVSGRRNTIISSLVPIFLYFKNKEGVARPPYSSLDLIGQKQNPEESCAATLFWVLCLSLLAYSYNYDEALEAITSSIF